MPLPLIRHYCRFAALIDSQMPPDDDAAMPPLHYYARLLHFAACRFFTPPFFAAIRHFAMLLPPFRAFRCRHFVDAALFFHYAIAAYAAFRQPRYAFLYITPFHYAMIRRLSHATLFFAIVFAIFSQDCFRATMLLPSFAIFTAFPLITLLRRRHCRLMAGFRFSFGFFAAAFMPAILR